METARGGGNIVDTAGYYAANRAKETASLPLVGHADAGAAQARTRGSAERGEGGVSTNFIYEGGYWWHVPCANLDQFPRCGKMIPSTIMTGVERIYVCEKCGITARTKRRVRGRKKE